MNWFTKEFAGNRTLAGKRDLVDQDGGCEHAESDASTVAWVHYENDTSGIVGSYACCSACHQKADEEEDNELHVCVDCMEEKPLKDGVEWKWYDFYAAQGDTPMFVCDCCRPKEKHQARLAKDRRDYEDEFPNERDDGTEVGLDDGDCTDPNCNVCTHHDPLDDILDCGHRYDQCDCFNVVGGVDVPVTAKLEGNIEGKPVVIPEASVVKRPQTEPKSLPDWPFPLSTRN